MPPDVSQIHGWDLASLLAAFSIISFAIGNAVAWAGGKGLDRWIRYKEFKLKEKAQLLKLNPKSQDFRDSLWEDKNLAAGYRALLLSWDERMQGVEIENQDMKSRLASLEAAHRAKTAEYQHLHTAYMDCLEKHAEEKERSAGCEKRISQLEKLCEFFQQKLKKNGIDPTPSPIHLPPALPPPSNEHK